MKINLVTFGGGQLSFRLAAKQLKIQAQESKRFKKIVAITDRSLAFDVNFLQSYQKFVNENEKGYGFWS